jgi:hypothetical protein
MRGFQALQRLSTLTSTNYSRFPQDMRKNLTRLSQVYETKFGDVRLRAHQSSATSN